MQLNYLELRSIFSFALLTDWSTKLWFWNVPSLVRQPRRPRKLTESSIAMESSLFPAYVE